MDRGELVDDETIVAIVRERLMRPDTDAGFVLGRHKGGETLIASRWIGAAPQKGLQQGK